MLYTTDDIKAMTGQEAKAVLGVLMRNYECLPKINGKCYNITMGHVLLVEQIGKALDENKSTTGWNKVIEGSINRHGTVIVKVLPDVDEG